MRFLRNHHHGLPVAMIVAMAVAAFVPAAHADDEVTVEITGDEMPGGTATATLTINDGSTLTSVAWTQTYGVTAALTGADTLAVSAVLGSEGEYKTELFHILMEPPIDEDQLPPGIEFPDGEFYGGIPDRFQVVGLNHFVLEEAALVTLEADVVTSSGQYTVEADVHTMIPWRVTGGINNVATGRAVLLWGEDQTAYDWALTAPSGSSATLMYATEQGPFFTPDVDGMYQVDVTSESAGETVSITVFAGTWRGVIVGQDAEGRPVADSACTGCHSSGSMDAFTPWAQTGHAEIFTNNLNNSTYYGEGCFDCHTVGFDTESDNGGVDDAADYQAFLDSGLIGNPGDNWTQVLGSYPETAQLANIQCENCHGPQESEAHRKGASRQNLSSNVCAQCHGEPLRHARFQQWQLSAHANYAVAEEEGMSGSCSRCHTANGFIAWLPVLTGDEAGDPADSVEVTWTEDQIHPQTCQTCHDPHAIGDASGLDNNATVRISGDTPELLAGFTATDVGRGAICMTCHNTRRGPRNDSNWDEVGSQDASRAPHGGAQADVLMGENAYFVNVGDRGFHSHLDDTCATCHMEATPPPDDLAYNQGGTNHTFYARNSICVECHDLVTADDVQGPVETGLEALEEMLLDGYMDFFAAQTAMGNTIDVNGKATIASGSEIAELMLGGYHGRQALDFTLTDGTETGMQTLNSIDVVTPAGTATSIDTMVDSSLTKGGWNYFLIDSDGSHGVHNPAWVNRLLAHTIKAVDEGGGGSGGDGMTGPGVSCTTPYTYWVEIATHAPGIGSVWRTDVVAKNMSDATANLSFVLHTSSGDVTIPASVDAMAQGVFEDIVGLMDVDDKGSLEICSDQRLQVIGRIYNVAENGSFGQFMDGLYNLIGLTEGQSARLLGLRQMEGDFRTNISVTNTGSESAEVMITLFGTDSTDLGDYTLTVGPGMVIQDTQPFKDRANQPNLGWGYAEVEVVTGSGVLCSASVVDSGTGDATTIPMKR